MAPSAQLGPFDLRDRIGEGGMGVVYRGAHRETGVPVALKIFRQADDPESRRRFHEEVQAHAGLQHPGIVYLFEYGEIDGAAADATDGELQSGQPFVAMELADRGTVRDRMPVSRWATVRRILAEVLDALAYSHARGVIHRDLKPANLLVVGTRDGAAPEWRTKLADFGIAHAIGREYETTLEDLESAAGTPYYMAPEQLQGQWRQYGPWTDLYALGCIAWQLVCGRPPFTGDHFLDIAVSHETDERPSLEPQFPVPDELERWIHRAMAPAVDDRFRRAADAALALPEPMPAEGRPAKRAGETSSERDPMATTRIEQLPTTVLLTGSQEAVSTVSPSDAPGATGDADGTPPDGERATGPDAPPVPEDWQPAHTDPLPAPLVGAGLGLFGLREPPFVDRTDPCDRVWDRLRTVVETQSAETVVIAGEAGTGKSRLAEWIATRAHEVGAVRVVRAPHTRGGGPTDGLQGAMERTLRTARMDRDDIYEYLLERLSPLEDRDESWRKRDARALTEYLRPTDRDAEETDGPGYQFSSADQKYALLVRMLERLARRRPVLLWLDDLQGGTEALGLLDYLHDTVPDPPEVLVLATVRSDIVRERPHLRERLEGLQATEAVSGVEIAPLARRYQRELLVRLLPLQDDLADRLAERTEGHPLFAMQLIGHWIERGAIEIASDGFRVADGHDLALPGDIHQLWRRRLQRLIDDLDVAPPATIRRAIERGAALGREVDRDEWRALCDILDIDRPEAIRDGLVERGLAEHADQGWAFAHGLLVDSLEHQAREADRWRDHHAHCADLLDTLYADRPRQTAARRAHHRIEAGQLERALAPLREEAERFRELGEHTTEKRTLARRGDMLDRLDLPDDDPRRVENDLERARVELSLGTPPDQVLASIDNVRERAERAGDDRLLAMAWHVTAGCRRRMGEFEAARDAADQATRHARAAGRATELIDALLQWGWSAFFQGELDTAEQQFAEAERRATDTGDRYRQLLARREMAWTALNRGDQSRASTRFDTTLRASRDAGYRSVESMCLNGLGEVARFDGDADAARRRYRQYGQLARELGTHADVALSYLNLAQVESMAGRFDTAADRLREAERRYAALSLRDDHIHILRLVRIARAAGTADWEAFETLTAHYDDGWPDEMRLAKDHPWLLEMAGDYASDHGEPTRADRAWRLARELWDRIGDDDAVERLDARLAASP